MEEREQGWPFTEAQDAFSSLETQTETTENMWEMTQKSPSQRVYEPINLTYGGKNITKRLGDHIVTLC